MFPSTFSPFRTPRGRSATVRPQLEECESRIAPAAVVRFVEVDGDRVTVKTTKGTSEELNAAIGGLQGANNVDGFLLDFLTVPGVFAGTSLTISASGGTGPSANRANAVTINAFNRGSADNIDFRNVVIKGDLVSIDAGDNDLATPAINKLIVTNWVPDPGTGNGVGSSIHFNITSINIKGNFDGAIL
jgi:hypothetical protein